MLSTQVWSKSTKDESAVWSATELPAPLLSNTTLASQLRTLWAVYRFVSSSYSCAWPLDWSVSCEIHWHLLLSLLSIFLLVHYLPPAPPLDRLERPSSLSLVDRAYEFIYFHNVFHDLTLGSWFHIKNAIRRSFLIISNLNWSTE